MIKGINFHPWVSDLYEQKRGKYGQLLVLGESHYSNDENQKDYDVETLEDDEIPDEAPSEFTTGVVNCFIERKCNINFFRNLGLVFNKDDSRELWNNIAFANGIQVMLSSSQMQPTPQEIETVKNTFWILLNALNPDKIIVCSKRMWNNWLPDDDKRGRKITDIIENGKHSTIWEYNINNKLCHAMGINHPSKYFSHKNWQPLVKKFIEEDFGN